MVGSETPWSTRAEGVLRGVYNESSRRRLGVVPYPFPSRARSRLTTKECCVYVSQTTDYHTPPLL